MSLFTLSQTTKSFASTKLKEFADNKLNVAKMMISFYDKVENIAGKGENADYLRGSINNTFSVQNKTDITENSLLLFVT